MLVECSNCKTILFDHHAFAYPGYRGRTLYLCPGCKDIGDAKADGRVYARAMKVKNAHESRRYK